MHSSLLLKLCGLGLSLLSLCLIGIIMAINPTITQAQEITLKHQGRILNAELSIANDTDKSKPIMLLVHGALAHRDMETLRYLRQLLLENGISSLAINLSLGIDNRRGMYDCKIPHTHTNEDAVAEIQSWHHWLEQQGFNNIVLLGHSRGGAQVALYNALYASDSVAAAVLMAPATDRNSNASAYQARYQQALAPLVDKALQMQTEKIPEPWLEKIGLMTCGSTSASAESFLSYYGPKSQVDTLNLLPKSRSPVLVIVAGADQLVVNLEQRVQPLVDRQRISMAVIDGSDHMFRDLNSDEAVEAIIQFLNTGLVAHRN